MTEKMKKIFPKLFKRKIFLIFLIVFGLFLSLPVSAVVIETVVNAFAAVLLFIPWLVGLTLFGNMALLLDWVTGPSFISLSYTNAGLSPGAANYNEIVGLGWSLMRDFANIIIVLALLVIGLATVLRIGEYQAKKTLPILVLVALLVNFSPVIAGLIIDGANIVMHSLLKDVTHWIVLRDTVTREDELSMLNKVYQFFTDPSFTGELLGLTLYYLLGAIILFFYTFLYLVRYLALWILVIFSPLAFACYILPATRKYFSLWWSQFLAWNFIGIMAAFFLSLANQLFFLIDKQREQIILGSSGKTFLDSLFPYFIPIVFLYLGLLVGFKTSAYGASTIVNWATSWAKKSLQVPGLLAGTIGKGVSRWAEEKLGVRERVGEAARAWERVPVARWFLPEKMRKYAEFRPAIEEAQKELSILSSKVLAHRIATGDIYGTRATAAMMELATRGDMEDLFAAYRAEHKRKTGEEVTDEDLLNLDDKRFEGFRDQTGRFLDVALMGSRFNDIVRRSPRLARIAAGRAGRPDIKELPKTKEGQDKAVAMIAEEMRDAHLPGVEREELTDKKLIEATMARKGRGFWEGIGRIVKRGRETSLETMEENFSEFIDRDPEYAQLVPAQREDYFRDPENLQKAWAKYREWYKETYKEDAFFSYLETDRAREQGWLMPRYKSLDLRKISKKPEVKRTPGEQERILALPDRKPAPVPPRPPRRKRP